MGQLVKRVTQLGVFTVFIFLQTSMALAAPKALPDVAEAGVRSVVNISSTKRMASRGMMSDPFLRRFSVSNEIFRSRGAIVLVRVS